MSSIYKCPCCGEKTFNPLTKAMAGTMRSKGRGCPKCNKLCVNGKGATIFNALYCLIAFVFIAIVYCFGLKTEWMYTHEMPICIGIIISMLIVPRLVNAFCFKMMETIRIDAYEK
jgi:hypothetical protein